MAATAPKLTRQRILAAAIETTTGTAVSLSGTDAAMNIFDPSIEADIETHERNGQSALSPLPPVAGRRAGKIKFKTEIVGNGASVTPWWFVFFKGCGFVNASGGVLSPLSGSSTAATLTMGMYLDGRFKSLAGASGDFTIMLETGKVPMVEWDFQGAWQAPSDVALLTPTYPTVQPEAFQGATVTVGGTAYPISKLTIKANNKIALRMNPASSGGVLSALVVERKITVSIDPEALPLATKDWYAAHLAGTTVALSCAHGSAQYNTTTIAAPAMALMSAPKIGDRDGIFVDELEFVCCRSSSGGDDELTITQS
jgi:hypothetical protein